MKKANALKIFGGVQKTADALGIAQPSVSEWDEEEIPKGREYQIYHIASEFTKALMLLPKLVLGF